MYEKLAPHYDDLFPLQQDILDFVGSPPEGLPPYLLDVGCGPGGLTQKLADQGWEVTGWEPQGAMAAEARKKGFPVEEKGMISLGETTLPRKQGAILCVGNTLPHVKSIKEAISFFRGVRNNLAPSGSFYLQFINFPVLRRAFPEGYSFPLLSAGNLEFRREYQWTLEGKVFFITRLIHKETGEETREVQELLFITPDDVAAGLETQGLTLQKRITGERAVLFHSRCLPL